MENQGLFIFTYACSMNDPLPCEKRIIRLRVKVGEHDNFTT